MRRILPDIPVMNSQVREKGLGAGRVNEGGNANHFAIMGLSRTPPNIDSRRGVRAETKWNLLIAGCADRMDSRGVANAPND